MGNSKHNRATDEALGNLHNELAKVLTKAITGGVITVDSETGEVIKETCPASILNVARQFLKDNGIDCVPTATNPLGNLAKSLPQFDSEGNTDTSPLGKTQISH